MGATGTGKSALALEIAQRVPAVIINADAMQLVAELRIITARPTDSEMARAPHALYGVLPAREPTSVATWLALVKPAVERAWHEQRLPLLVGGTGMYIQSMMRGLATVPTIPAAIRERVRVLDAAARWALLEQHDPAMAARLKPGDTQRVQRALEVHQATGVSLLEWQRCNAQPVFAQAQYRCAYVDLPRDEVYARINARFLQMMEQGALEEVRALMRQSIPPAHPILRAHGVPELVAHLEGRMTYDDAISRAQLNTRHYAKRQLTWLRNQMPQATALAPGDVRAALSLL